MQRQNGFTLLEVLFALSILAVGLLALATAFPASYMSMNNAQTREHAMKLVENGIEYVKTLGYDRLPYAWDHPCDCDPGGPIDPNCSRLFREDCPEVLDVDQDGIILPNNKEIRFYQVLINQPVFDMTTVIVTARWVPTPRRIAAGDYVTEDTTATIIFDRYF